MKFATIDGKDTEATKGARGLCRYCGSELIAKCGEVKVNHWAHKGKRNCDPWWENETEWHRSWKEKFSLDWQEVIQFDDSGEKHIADVKTQTGMVIEFQHSYLNPEERRARNAFYSKLVWVVDGLRRKTDIPQFEKAIKESTLVSKEPPIRRVRFPEECRLLEEWHNSNALVFFDFQEAKASKQLQLWFLFPKVSNSAAYITPFSRVQFIELLNKNEFEEIVRNAILPDCKKLASYEQSLRKVKQKLVYSRPNRLSGFQRHKPYKKRNRRRFYKKRYRGRF